MIDSAGDRIRKQIEPIEDLKKRERFCPEFAKWRRDTEVVIERVFGGGGRHLADFQGIKYASRLEGMLGDRSGAVRYYHDALDTARSVLESMADEADEFGVPPREAISLPTSTLLTDLCHRFHRVARQLRKRHDSRPTLEVEDEYDVQDLMHAMLWLFFDDVRPEEWVPSYAGSGSRVDFLLKNEETIVEIKKTRSGLADKVVGEQLIVDIAKYQTHPSCKALFCFIYDPDGRISNPQGLERDLSRSEDDLRVDVVIAPIL